MIKTEEQFNTELANLTGVSIPKTPCKFITLNDGWQRYKTPFG